MTRSFSTYTSNDLHIQILIQLLVITILSLLYLLNTNLTMDSQAMKYCSSCKCDRPISEFPVNKQGKQLKMCSKHVKKQPLPEVDEWVSFLYEINSWSKIVSYIVRSFSVIDVMNRAKQSESISHIVLTSTNYLLVLVIHLTYQMKLILTIVR